MSFLCVRGHAKHRVRALTLFRVRCSESIGLVPAPPRHIMDGTCWTTLRLRQFAETTPCCIHLIGRPTFGEDLVSTTSVSVYRGFFCMTELIVHTLQLKSVLVTAIFFSYTPNNHRTWQSRQNAPEIDFRLGRYIHYGTPQPWLTVALLCWIRALS